MSWQLLVVINVLAASVVIPLQRALLHKNKTDPIAFVIVSQTLTAVLLTPYVIAHGIHLPNFTKYGLVMMAMFALYSLGHILYANTLKEVEASVFSTLLNTSTIWIMLMGYVIFHEHVRLFDLLGASLILASVGILTEYKGRFRLDRSIYMGLLVGFIFGLAFSAWVYVGKHSDLVTWTGLSFVGTPLIILLLIPGSVRKMKPFLNSVIITKLLLLAVFWVTSNLASLAAYQRGKVSVITPLRMTSVIVTVLLSIIFLKERTRLWQKTLAAVVCFIGVLLIIS